MKYRIAERLRNPPAGAYAAWSELPGAAMNIEQARAAYDRGEVELAHEHSDTHVYLVVIPRQKRVDRGRPLFSPLGESAS